MESNPDIKPGTIERRLSEKSIRAMQMDMVSASLSHYQVYIIKAPPERDPQAMIEIIKKFITFSRLNWNAFIIDADLTLMELWRTCQHDDVAVYWTVLRRKLNKFWPEFWWGFKKSSWWLFSANSKLTATQNERFNSFSVSRGCHLRRTLLWNAQQCGSWLQKAMRCKFSIKCASRCQ